MTLVAPAPYCSKLKLRGHRSRMATLRRQNGMRQQVSIPTEVRAGSRNKSSLCLSRGQGRQQAEGKRIVGIQAEVEVRQVEKQEKAESATGA